MYAQQLEEIEILLHTFFKEVLKIDDEELVEKISCEIEHHITRNVKESFKDFLSKYHK
jgi:Mn-dependent DtxR family transcriptional regulator